MSDSLNKVLSKLVTSIEGVKNEREMLLRLIIGLAVFLLLAVFKSKFQRLLFGFAQKLWQEKANLHKKRLLTLFQLRFHSSF